MTSNGWFFYVLCTLWSRVVEVIKLDLISFDADLLMLFLVRKLR